MKTNISYVKVGILFFCMTSIALACTPLPPYKYTLSTIYGTTPDETITASVGQTVSFAGSSKFYCPNSGSITEYKWVLPAAAYGIKGQNLPTMTCKFSPAGTHYVELQVKCSHNLWNTGYGSYPTYNRYFVSVTVGAVTGPWYVKPDGSDDNNGQSWNTAFHNIQTAINSAVEGQEILVHEGTYYEQLDFKGKSLNVHSCLTTDDSVLAPETTIIDANKQGTAVIFRGSENGGQLNGLTILGGNPAEDELALYLDFDDVSSLGRDVSGKERDGNLVFTGDPNWVVGPDGGDDKALQLTGDDYIQIEGYKGVAGNHPRSCAAWIQTANTAQSRIFGWGTSQTGQFWALYLTSTGKLRLGISGGYVEAGIVINDGIWHHVAAVFPGDESNNLLDIKLYIDGVQQTTVSGNYTGNPPSVDTRLSEGVCVGAYLSSSLIDPFIGALDEVRVYSRALSGTEIQDLGMIRKPVTWLEMDSSVADKTPDKMGINDGILKYDATINTSDSQMGTGSLQLGSGTGYVDLGNFNYVKTYFSISMWFKTSSTNAWLFDSTEVPGSKSSTGIDDWTDLYLDSNGYLVFRFQCGLDDIVAGTGVNYNDGYWHHVVAEKVGSYTAKLYVDGQLMASATSTGGGTGVDAPQAVNIGRQTDGTGYFTGLIDDVQIYVHALSQDEILRLTGDFGLVGYWKLDEENGTEASDDSGQNHTGTLVNFPASPWIDGRVDGGLTFDGIDDYVQITDYKGITGTASRTCSAWIKTTNTGLAEYILSWGADVAGQKWTFRVESNGTLSAAVYAGYVNTTTTINDGQWHHVAAVLNSDNDPTANEILLYIDGILQSTTASSSQAINTVASQDVLIGVLLNGGALSGYFNGDIDDVQIYDRALSQDEILEMAENDGLAGYWKLDGNANDSSCNAFHGDPNGDPDYSDGILGQAMDFDGDNCVIVQNPPLGLICKTVTMSAWVKADNPTGTVNQFIINRKMTNSGTYSIFEYDGLWKAVIKLEGSVGTGRIIQSTSSATTNWTHLCATYDGYIFKLYVNGILENSLSITGALNQDDAGELMIGAHPTLVSYFDGKIDDVRIYNRAISDSEIRALYQQRFSAGGGIRGNGTTATITQCIIEDNQTSESGGGLSGINGTVSNCYVLDNAAQNAGGGLADCDGGILNSIIAQNTAQNGGGLYNCDGNIVNCTITGNTATDGGAVYIYSSYPLLKNNIFSDNIAQNNGGAVYLESLSQSLSVSQNIINCTFYGNQATLGGGIYCKNYYEVVVSNSIFWMNTAVGGHVAYLEGSSGAMSRLYAGYSDFGVSSNAIVRNSTTYTDYTQQVYWYTASNGCGTIWYMDPQLVGPEEGDFHLKSEQGRYSDGLWVMDDVTSQCINTGNSEYEFANEPSPNGGRINLGAYGNTEEASKFYVPSRYEDDSVIEAFTGVAGGSYGASIAVDGMRMAVGSPNYVIENSVRTGAVFIYECTNGVWSKTAIIIPADSSYNYFGWHVALSGDYLAVSRWGHVYIFNKSGSTWYQKQDISTGGTVSSFDMNSNYLIVGQESYNVSSNLCQGRVRIYKRNLETDSFAPLDDDNEPILGTRINGYLGSSVSLDGEWLAIGESGYYNGTAKVSGKVYLYKLNEGTFEYYTVIDSTISGFGKTVCVSGSILAISNFMYNSEWIMQREGAVCIYSCQDNQWSLETTLYPPFSDIWGGGYFFYGETLCLKDSHLIVGARADSDFNGTAYVYEKENGKWTLLFRPMPSQTSLYQYCRSVAITDEFYFISSEGGSNSTPVFIYNH